jgi:hypothetical protein
MLTNQEKATIGLTQERIDYVAKLALLPFALLINFSLFQYLMGLFFHRREQPLTSLLLVCAFVGVVALIPFSTPNEHVFTYLNDISELASTLTFLVQIVIVGRDICKKVKIKALLYITALSQLIIAISVLLMTLTLFKIADDRFQADWLDTADKAAQAVALWFIFVFRFYYISLARGGFAKTLRTRRGEILLYLLFATNQYPFVVLHELTQLNWDPVQACWHRLTLMMCILHTIHDKYKSSGSSNRGTRAGKSTWGHVGTGTPSKPSKVGPMESVADLERCPSITKGSESKNKRETLMRPPNLRGMAVFRFMASLFRVKRRKSVQVTPSIVCVKKVCK